MILSQRPALAIWGIVTLPLPYIMAFGGVATGSINAQLAAMVAGMTKSIGSCPIPMAEEARIGRNAAAVAVLLVISVRKMTTRITTSISSRMGRAPSPLTPLPIHATRPELLIAEDRRSVVEGESVRRRDEA